jgi:hypothetical protein
VTDGTRVHAGPDTSLHVGHREIGLEQGALTAHVARQTDGHRWLFRTPDAEVTVLGTVLRLEVASRSTRLDVLEGKVRMKSLSDSRVVEVTAGGHEIVVPGFIVSPRGTPQGDGSLSKPWDLTTALSHPAVMPGDTISLRAGVYKGLFRSALRGLPTAPIVVRPFGRERATVDGGIEAQGEWTTFRGLEIINSGPDRGPQRPAGLVLRGRGHRAINLIVHDTGNPGIAFREEVGDGGEISGCLLWGNGVVLPDGRRAGSGVSAQNREGTRRIRETIAFRNYQSGLFVFAEQGYADGFQLEGNVVFDHPRWGILATGGENPISSLRVTGNFSFSRRPAPDGDLIRFGLVPQARNGSIVVQQNVFVLGLADEAFHLFQWRDVRVSGNTIVGRNALARWTPGDAGARVWNDNAYFTDGVGAFLLPDARLGYSDWKAKTGFDEDSTLTPWAPGDAKIFVRPNPHEPGRAHVIMVHGERTRSVAADLTGVLHPGGGYVVRDAEDYFGPAVAQGTFDGTPILLPAARDFAVFVVESTGLR